MVLTVVRVETSSLTNERRILNFEILRKYSAVWTVVWFPRIVTSGVPYLRIALGGNTDCTSSAVYDVLLIILVHFRWGPDQFGHDN